MRHTGLVVLALSACGVDSGQFDGFSAELQNAKQRMHVRFAAAERIELSIAHGDLDQARANAHSLAQVDEPNALPVWRPYLDGVRDTAHQIELANDVAAAARLTALLGQRCANCHVAIDAHVHFAATTKPVGDVHLAPRMLGHQWAVARMWNGLVGPSDEEWLAGARALADSPFNLVADQAIDDAARVRLYARRALNARPGDTRADVFGTLLATCVHCHAALRDR